MRCPSCRHPAAEHLAVCGHCGFCLEAVDRALGAPPAMTAPLTDAAAILTRREKTAVLGALNAFSSRHPQIVPVCVLANVPPGVPVEICTFWIHNRAGFFSLSESGGRNHGLLLVLDPQANSAAAMPGYGLEPFIGEDDLAPALAAARLSLDSGDPARAAGVFFREMSARLLIISENLPQAFGYDETRPWLDLSGGDDWTIPSHEAADVY